LKVSFYGETPFEGTVLNITFKTKNFNNETKWAIEGMQLKEFIKAQPWVLTPRYSEGKQLSRRMHKILLARSIVTQPKILFSRTQLITWMMQLQTKSSISTAKSTIGHHCIFKIRIEDQMFKAY
jgi:hypothetical protein